MAQSIRAQLDGLPKAAEAAAKVVEMLAVQSKAATVTIELPGTLLAEPILASGYGSGLDDGLEGVDPAQNELDEVAWHDGGEWLATVRLAYNGVPRKDPDRVNDRALAEFMLSLIGPLITRELRQRSRLSMAEARVAKLLTLSNKEISQELGVSKETVRVHIKSIHRKLGTSTREEIVAILERTSRGED